MIAGGTAGCQRLFDEFRAREISQLAPDYASTRLSIDVYCLQHPDRYCVSAKSLAAHLTGLALAIDRHPPLASPTDPSDAENGLRSLQQWLDGRAHVVKPVLPQDRGSVTVADIAAAEDTATYLKALDGWARATWAAYSELHATARAWVRVALETRR